jgi:hypothetical protein
LVWDDGLTSEFAHPGMRYFDEKMTDIIPISYHGNKI